MCILEQFQNQSSLQMADRVLKELGAFPCLSGTKEGFWNARLEALLCLPGKEHAKEAMAKRKPVMPSRHFIQTFVASFCEDPVLGRARAAAAAADDDEAADEADAGAEKTGLAAALAALQRGLYEAVVPGCCDELSEPSAPAANRHQVEFQDPIVFFCGCHRFAHSFHFVSVVFIGFLILFSKLT